MKDKIMLFVIGILLGAVIATGAFYVYTTTNNNSCSNSIQMNGGTPPELPGGQNNETGNPPEKPNENNSQSNN